MADIGEVKIDLYTKLEPKLVGNEENINDSSNEFHKLPLRIEEEPEVSFPCDCGSGRTSSRSPNGVKEEWIEDVTVEELDVDSLDSLGGCSNTEKQSEASECLKSNEDFLEMRRAAEKNGSHLCDVCGSRFTLVSVLKKHMMTHTGGQPHVCDLCGLGFNAYQSLKNHKRTHIRSPEPQKHNRAHSGERSYVCHICGEGFKVNAYLRVHMMSHTEERPYVCDVCGEGFKDYQSLKYHKRRHTEESCSGSTLVLGTANVVADNHVCDVCGSRFDQKKTLRNHMRRHTEEKPYVCNICGKGFKQIAHVRSHTRTHSGEKPYICDICGKGFKQIAHLRRHIGTHSGDKPYVCDTCCKGFKDYKTLKCHKRHHTEESGSSSTLVHGTANVMADNAEVKDTQEEPILESCGEISVPHSIEKQPKLYSPSIKSAENANITADNDEIICTKLEPELVGIKEEHIDECNNTFQELPVRIKEEPKVNSRCGAENANIMADIGEVNFVKLKPELVIIKEEPSNDRINECQELPAKIKKEPLNVRCDGGSRWSPNGVKEEWIDDVGVEELDVDTSNVDPLGGCSHTENKSEASECFGSSEVVTSQTSKERLPHLCTMCGSSFSLLCTFNKHVMTHTGTVSDVCGQGFINRTSLKKNQRRHTEGQKKVRDSVSGGFEMDSTLKRVPSGKRPHVCDICDMEFPFSSSLENHKRSHTGERPFVCDICGLGFAVSFTLKNHMRTHTGERPFVCDVCGKGFKQIPHLRGHTRTHSGEKPYVCDTCGKGFKQIAHLKYHTTTHTGEKAFNCDICGLGLATSDTLKSHMRTHMGEKPHVCNICGKGFKQIVHLTGHMRTHSGERPHVCDICGKRFKQIVHLRRHTTTHSGERPHVCDICGKGFKLIEHLRRHTSKHSG